MERVARGTNSSPNAAAAGSLYMPVVIRMIGRTSLDPFARRDGKGSRHQADNA
jgi:hypothetical protein